MHDPMTLFDLPNQPATSPTQRALALGIHPANGQPLHPDPTRTCGTCLYHRTNPNPTSRTYQKCEHHRLGITRSAASDIRLHWPACTHHHPHTDSVPCPDCAGTGWRPLTPDELTVARAHHRNHTMRPCPTCCARGRTPTPPSP